MNVDFIVITKGASDAPIRFSQNTELDQLVPKVIKNGFLTIEGDYTNGTGPRKGPVAIAWHAIVSIGKDG
jgi:hypothetical protein